MNSSIRLGWRTLWRDLRAGELRLLIVAVLLAVAALTAVGFFADRLKGGLQRDARQLLGGDVVLASDNPTPAAVIAQAQALGLQGAITYGFPTMARAADAQGGASKLVSLKAVSTGYPLRGSLQTATSNEGPGQTTRDIPSPGDVWVDGSLLDSLALKVGDPLLLGDASLRIARVIVQEPDRGGGFMSFSPRVMLNQADVARTALVQPASRINYRFAVAGEDRAVKTFTDATDAVLKQGQLRGARLESFESGRPEMRQTLDRAEKFLNLVALLAALLSAVAVALAARGFAASHLDDCAMLRVLGQSQRTIAGAYAFEFALIGLFASAVGVAIGFVVHYAFVLLLAGLVETALPAPTLWPVAFGLGMGLVLLFTFGLPPVLQLAKVPPLRVIRRDVGGLKPASLAVLGIGVLGFVAMLLAASSDLKLGLIAVGGFAGAVAVFAALSWVAVKVLRRSVNENTAPRWLVLATRQISARPAYAVVQVSALAVGLLALVLLVLLRTDLVSSWRRATPPDAPNRFVINVMPDQSDAFQKSLRDGGVSKFDWYPMIRGRLVAVNDKPVSPDDYAEDRAKRLVDREFNLSNSTQMPEHNSISAGTWKPDAPGEVSVEDGLAETLGLKLGDKLRFDIGGIQNDARITSLRKVDWGSLHANFFVMYTVANLPDVPVTYMGAFRAPETRGFDNALVRAYPNVTNVDMSATIGQVQRAELVGVGLLAGFLASIAASASGWGLARYVFDFAWTASLWLPVAGAVAGAVLALAAGWWGLRDVLRRPVVDTLRRAAE
ncbi:MAG: permease FtsX-like protein [Variovorax sp.]|nr:permease FtsX-like protein [Variovorax sp.]